MMRSPKRSIRTTPKSSNYSSLVYRGRVKVALPLRSLINAWVNGGNPETETANPW